MEALMPYIIQTLGGAGGGWLGNMLKNNGLGMVGTLLSGAVGGNVLPMVLNMVMGNSDGGSMIMNIIMAIVGGGAGSFIGGLIGGNKAS